MPAILGANAIERCIANYARKSHDKSAVRLPGAWGLIGNSSSAMLVHLRTMTISCACQVRLLLHLKCQGTHHIQTNTRHVWINDSSTGGLVFGTKDTVVT